MSSDQTEHGFKLTAGLEYTADCAQHEQPQTFIGELAFLRSEEMGQGAADALGAVPFQPIQIVTDGVIFIAVSDNGDCLLDFLFAGQCVLIFQIEHQIIQVRIVQGRCRLAPPERLHNINAFRQDVVADRSFQLRVILKYGQTVSYAVFDRSVIGRVQTSSDCFHGHARLGVLQIVAQDSSPLFFARQPEPSFPLLCHTEEHPADIRYGFLFAELPRTENAIRPPAALVRIAASMS